MLLSIKNYNDIKELYQKVYPIDDPARPGVDHFISNPDLIFNNKLVFGVYHNERLVSAISLVKTNCPNVCISTNFVSDKSFPNVKTKFSCVIASQQYAVSHGYRIVKIVKSRIGNALYNYNKKGNLGFADYKLIERIMPGKQSVIPWINQKYFFNQPVTEEWIVGISI